MNFSIIFLKIWTDFWTLTVDRRVFSSWISFLLSHSCLESKVCGISFKSFPCVNCLTRSSQAQARIACCFSLSRFASSSYPHMPWQGLHGTLTSPPTATPAWRSINNESKSHEKKRKHPPTPTPAWRSINNVSKSHGTLTSPPPQPQRGVINNESKSHGTLTSPPPQPQRGIASTTWATSPPTPTPAWRSINNVSKSHGTLTSPPPQPQRGVASTTRASHMER